MWAVFIAFFVIIIGLSVVILSSKKKPWRSEKQGAENGR